MCQPEQVIHFGLQYRAQLLAGGTAHAKVLLGVQNQNVDAFKDKLDDLVLLLVDIAICLRLLHFFHCLHFCFYLIFFRFVSVFFEVLLLNFLRILDHRLENLEVNLEQFNAHFLITLRSQCTDFV